MFDYVIVGGGSAGCVVAARLAEDPGSRVLLLEAGPDGSAVDEIQVPAAYNRLFRSKYDWNLVTLPQERADGRPVYWPRGKVLGGSSAMNAMIYIRGNKADYDGWRDDYGCAGWGYRELLPYFRRAEDNGRGESAYHGVGGPLSVQDLRHKSEHTRHFIEAAVRRGAIANEDFNGAAAGRGRLLPGHPAGRPALQRRRRLPGRPAEEPHRRHRRPGDRGADRGRPGGRGHLPPPGPRRDRAGRGRGDPGGGRDRLASAADALRHRPGRPPARARHLRDRRPAVGRRQPHRPPVGPGALVHPVAQGPVGVVGQRRLRPLAADPQGPADLEHRRGGRIRPERPEADRARPAVARAAGRVPRAGPVRPGQPRDDRAGHAGRRGQPGPPRPRLPRPEAPSAGRPRLPVRRPRPVRARGRGADGARLRDGRADVEDLRAGTGAGRRGAHRPRDARLHPGQHRDVPITRPAPARWAATWPARPAATTAWSTRCCGSAA